jgi:hypothetical protein
MVGPQTAIALGMTGDPGAAASIVAGVVAAPGWARLPATTKPFLQGAMRFASGRIPEAEVDLRAAASAAPPSPVYQATAILGELLFHERRWGDALPVLEKVRTFPFGQDDGSYAWLYPRVLLRMAQAHDALGQHEQARTRLAELQALWARADADLPLVGEARALGRRLVAPRVASEARP